MWIVLHAIFWDGKAKNVQDVIDSLLTPGQFKLMLKVLFHYFNLIVKGVRIELSGDEEPNRRNDNLKPYPESYYQFSSPEGQNSNQDNAQDRISLDSFNTLINVSSWQRVFIVTRILSTCVFQSFTNELSPIKFWNFFADPEKSTRNLWLNVGFVSSIYFRNFALFTLTFPDSRFTHYGHSSHIFRDSGPARHQK